jgi:hypothetical protein
MGTGMSNTKKVTISLTPEQQDKARSLSKDLFGKENISGLIGFLIERWEKEQNTSKNVKSKRSGSNGA